MTAKKKNENAGKKDGQNPLFTFRLVLILVLLGGASAAITTIYRSNQIAKNKKKFQKANKNPNVIKLPAVPKKDYKPPLPNKTQAYREKTIFPYLKKNQKPVRNCYYSHKWKTKPRRGVVGLSFDIGPSGKPLNIRFYKDEIKVKAITGCILKQANKWKFQPHAFKGNIAISFPFAFF